ncbi:toxin secretion/phage lysis holin family protein [Heliorestis convoluta]|uniref:Toxin secretion/phage lysis holin family protein n=2 Tax=Heliorestis convoluta TaxID=356322 RepID=A0A5Q2MXQ2_9FIRM|nr:toxin secretion/phage lysis holin family protein [Heliorestis convoluta]
MVNGEFLGYVKMAFAAVGAFLGWFLGSYDGFLYALIMFIVLDYITGLMVAYVTKEISSHIGSKGIFKKVVIFILVGVAQIIDSQIIGEGSVIRTAVIFFYLSNEGISIIENAGKLGLPIPAKLRDSMDQLKDKEEERDEPRPENRNDT